MNINAPTFVPVSDAKSPSSEHTQDIKHSGKPPVERQQPRKHQNKPRPTRGKGSNRSQHHHHNPSQKTNKAQKGGPLHEADSNQDGQTLSNVSLYRCLRSLHHSSLTLTIVIFTLATAYKHFYQQAWSSLFKPSFKFFFSRTTSAATCSYTAQSQDYLLSALQQGTLSKRKVSTQCMDFSTRILN